MINQFNFNDTETRIGKYIMPQKIIKTDGDVTNANALLTYRDRQVQLQEREVTVLRGQSHVLLDFGCEFHGGAIIVVHKVKGANSAKVHLRFGESVGEALAPLGYKGACNDHSARDFCVDVMPYSTNQYATTGYRFLYVGLESECELHLKSVQGAFIYQPYEYIGSFKCSDKRLNKIFDVSAYTCHLCLQNQLWDGIKRDRLVWIGDMSPELKTIKYIFGSVPEIASGLRLAADDARLPKWVNTIPTYSLWWLINLGEWCEYTSDYALLDELCEYTVGLTRQIIDNVDGEGNFTQNCFIDWPTKAAVGESREATRALIVMCMDACKKMCTYLKEDELARECEKVRARAASRTADGGGFKQLAALILLAGIGDKKSEDVLKADGARGFSTFMSYYILSAMARVCDTDYVLECLKEYYGGMLDMGATTFWEDFDLAWTKNACRIDEIPCEGKSDIHGDNGNYCYLGYRHSLCHGWSSGPVPFLIEQVLGIKLIDGCKKIKIEPSLGSLEYAKGSIATPYGKVSVWHKRLEDGTVHTAIDAPEGIEII